MRASIVDTIAVARQAYQRPEVRFVAEKRHAAFIQGVFALAFTKDRTRMRVDEFHELIDRSRAELRDRGDQDVPARDARALCQVWVEQDWLAKDLGPDGREWYQPSAAAQAATSWVASQARRRMVSAPRVAAIFDLVADLASLADPDVEEAIEHRKREIEQLQGEVERLEGGGGLAPGSEDDLIQHVTLVADAMEQIPADFRRVGEQFTTAHHDLRDQVLLGQDPAGQTMLAVAVEAEKITTATSEGRAFTGASDLIRDEAAMGELRRNIDRIMSSDLSAVFTDAERVLFADIASVFVAHVGEVLAGPRALSRLVSGRLGHHVSGRENDGVDELLRQARAALKVHTGPVPAGTLPHLASLDRSGKMLRLPEGGPPEAPRPLAQAPRSSAQPMTTEQLRRWGGPRLAAIADHIDTLLALSDGEVTLGQAWAQAGPDLTRSVELLGYFTHPAREGHPTGRERIEVTDESGARTLDVPRIVFTATPTETELP